MRKPWTDREEKYLENQYTNKSSDEIAKRLNRTIYSVRHKAAKMNLGHYNDNLSAKGLARCFDCDIGVILRWIKKLNLPVQEIVYPSMTSYVIDHKKFWKWAEEHKNEINWRKYKLNSLPLEPKWVIGEKHKMINSRNREKYTDYEIEKIKCLLYKGMNYKEISKELNRNYDGVSDMCRKILKNRM